MSNNKKKQIVLENGYKAEAHAPVIVSASRSRIYQLFIPIGSFIV